VAQFALFLFSGTFAPPESYPAVLRFVIGVTPLYQGVELLRGLTTGMITWSLAGNALYLAGMAAIGLWIASRRMGKLLCK
jgi:lipooligosaccharide transport system permease protein